MVNIRPDPAHPRGGYACITLEASQINATEVSLTIRNQFNDKYLGQDGWQGVKAYFGPYAVEISGDTAKLVVGTEIVNHLEEYTPLSIGIDGKEFEASWPDDIAHGPPAAIVGGVAPSPQARAEGTGPTLVGKAKDKPDETDNDPGNGTANETNKAGEGLQQNVTEGASDATASQEKSKTGLLIGIAVLLLAVVGGGAYWFMTQDAPVPVAEDPAPTETETVVLAEPEPLPEPANPCSDEALDAAAAENYGALIELLGQCSRSVSADSALLLIERGVAQEDARALATMGSFYDGSVEIDVLETEMGLTFADNPARAAEYYARAIAAGDGVGASDALGEVCERLRTVGDTLSQSALQDFCATSQ
ncbi:MAG: hypothetical protein AAF922_18655 [Pseudomonadota bacterium]